MCLIEISKGLVKDTVNDTVLLNADGECNKVLHFFFLHLKFLLSS